VRSNPGLTDDHTREGRFLLARGSGYLGHSRGHTRMETVTHSHTVTPTVTLQMWVVGYPTSVANSHMRCRTLSTFVQRGALWPRCTRCHKGGEVWCGHAEAQGRPWSAQGVTLNRGAQPAQRDVIFQTHFRVKSQDFILSVSPSQVIKLERGWRGACLCACGRACVHSCSTAVVGDPVAIWLLKRHHIIDPHD
jgi:hypothetical protein